MRYILTTDGTWGDTLPFVFLAKELIKNGHDVCVITNAFYKQYIENQNIKFIESTSIEDRKNFLLDKDLWNPYKGMDVIGQYSGIIFDKTMRVLEKINPKDIDMIISHAFVYSAKTYCQIHNISYSCLLISPIQVKSSYRLPIFYGGKDFNFIPHIIKKIIYPFIDKFILDPKFSKNINQYRIKNGLKPVESFVFWSTISDLTLCLWPQWYSKKEKDYKDYIKFCNFPKNVEIDDHPNKEILNWINSGEKPIIVTLGSGYLHSEKMLINLKKLSEKHNKRIIFIGPQKQYSDINLANKLITINHVSFSQTLPLCAIAIHHGGAGTLAQVIQSGIPHIVIPQSHDQPDNASHIKRNGLGEIIWEQCPNEEKLYETILKIEKSKEIKINCTETRKNTITDIDGIKKAAKYLEKFCV